MSPEEKSSAESLPKMQDEEKPARTKITVNLTDELARKMEKYTEVNWSEVARKAFWDYIQERADKKK